MRVPIIELTLAGLFVFSSVALGQQKKIETQPEVTITEYADKTVEEYRVKGFLYAVKVIPQNADMYYLIRADGTEDQFIRTDKPELRIPSWQIFSW